MICKKNSSFDDLRFLVLFAHQELNFLVNSPTRIMNVVFDFQKFFFVYLFFVVFFFKISQKFSTFFVQIFFPNSCIYLGALN